METQYWHLTHMAKQTSIYACLRLKTIAVSSNETLRTTHWSVSLKKPDIDCFATPSFFAPFSPHFIQQYYIPKLAHTVIERRLRNIKDSNWTSRPQRYPGGPSQPCPNHLAPPPPLPQITSSAPEDNCNLSPTISRTRKFLHPRFLT